MPKIPSEGATGVQNVPLISGSSMGVILKRNQACHQCRRRKLKCDAQRPACGTCIRSHKNAVKNAPPGQQVPPLECIFDDPPASENGGPANPTPKTRYEKLENRINDLESLLRQKDAQLERLARNVSRTSSFGETSAFNQPSKSSGNSPALGFTDDSPPTRAHISPTVSPPLQSAGLSTEPLTSKTTTVLWPNWPNNLPTFELLHHLVEVFFAFSPHARRMFHISTFRNSLMLSPTDKDFPHVAVLHAICAFGSFYTNAVPPPPPPDFNDSPADDLFHDAYKRRKALPDTFGETHARLSAKCIDESTAVGERLFENLQAVVILCWFFHSQARWTEMFLMTGRATRHAIPLGLNVCPPFHSIAKVLRAPSIIPPAKTVLGDETRRNTFWLVYCLERLYASGNGWAMSLDDQDVSQLLPVTGEHFELGLLVPPKERQWAHAPGILLLHPPDETDSFVLFVKSCLLMSKVKNFNVRFRARHFAGDPDVVAATDLLGGDDSAQYYVDPRESKSFKEIDHLLSCFIPSFPGEYQDPTRGGVLDLQLLSAHLTPYVAMILLHDPHMDINRANMCISAQKVFGGAHAILNLLYSIWAISYDLSFLDNFCCFAFFMVGRVLIRFLQLAKDHGNDMQAYNIRTELEYIRVALAKIGVRIPLAYRYAKMLDDILIQSVGAIDDVIITSAHNPFSSESMFFADASQNGAFAMPSTPPITLS